MAEPRFAPTYDDLVQLIAQRAAELGLSHNAVDDLSGLPSGHIGKLAAHTKNIGFSSLYLVLPVVGFRLALIPDDELAKKYTSRVVPRNAKQSRTGQLHRPGVHAVDRVVRHLAKEYSWEQIKAAVQEHKDKIEREQEAKAAREQAEIERKAANAAKAAERPAAPAAASAYSGPILTTLGSLADEAEAASLRVNHRNDGRGGNRGTVSSLGQPMLSFRADLRRKQAAYLTRKANAAAATQN